MTFIHPHGRKQAVSFPFLSRALRWARLVFLVGAWLALPLTQSYACFCRISDTPTEEWAQSAIVFRGRVVTIYTFPRRGGIGSSRGPAIVKFKVKTVWKGTAHPTRYLATRHCGGGCGYPSVVGTEYVVYSQSGLTVHLCSRTRPLAEASRDLADLGPGTPPSPWNRGTFSLLVVLLLGVSLGSAGAGDTLKRKVDRPP